MDPKTGIWTGDHRSAAPDFLIFARPTYLPVKKKILVIENGDISRWTLKRFQQF